MATSGGNNIQNNPAMARQGSNHADRFNIWLADLESIRREQPVVSPSVCMPKRVISQAPPTPGKGTAGSEEVVVLDDDDGAAPQAGSPMAMRAFYGLGRALTERSMEMIRYQDYRLALQSKYPSPQNGLGFDMAKLRQDKAWASPVTTLEDVQPAWDHAMFMTSPPLGFDEAVSQNWTQDSSSTSLLYGFPMLGDVVFYRAMNYRGARSACFFKALAYLVYGDQSLYQRVQAEHLQHFSEVLQWEDHPR